MTQFLQFCLSNYVHFKNNVKYTYFWFYIKEERRRTGRYVAVTLAICITLLGLCQTMAQHTPVVAGLFAPAIIMFLYLFWVLYTASKTNEQPDLQQITVEATVISPKQLSGHIFFILHNNLFLILNVVLLESLPCTVHVYKQDFIYSSLQIATVVNV